jgi:hypothetical protein
MFPHLRLWLITLWTFCVAGTVVTLNLSLGYYTLGTFLWAVVAGLAIGIPAALLNWAYLRPNRARQVGVLGQIPPDRC